MHTRCFVFKATSAANEAYNFKENHKLELASIPLCIVAFNNAFLRYLADDKEYNIMDNFWSVTLATGRKRWNLWQLNVDFVSFVWCPESSTALFYSLLLPSEMRRENLKVKLYLDYVFCYVAS